MTSPSVQQSVLVRRADSGKPHLACSIECLRPHPERAEGMEHRWKHRKLDRIYRIGRVMHVSLQQNDEESIMCLLYTACLLYCPRFCCAKSFTTSIDHRQVRIPPSIPTISAAVTACEGMSEWEMALDLFFKSPYLSSRNKTTIHTGCKKIYQANLKGQVLVLFSVTTLDA